ncbi:hypothetical protein HDU81_008006 [Chytriomyces hyalinus]|nr:hypothetical protein HDU81_008006 [Chytriomyces hyalinus]
MPNISATNTQPPQFSNATSQTNTHGANPIVAANDFILLPIYCMGIVMNGAILLAMLFKWRTTTCLSIRIEKVAAILILVCFLWSIDSAARYAIPQVTAKDVNRRVQGILSSGFILLLQGLNITFAIERFLIVKRWNSSSILKAIIWEWLGVVLFLITVTVTFTITKMVDDSLTPDDDYYIIWIVSMGLAFLITLILTVTLHSLTYRTSLKELKQALESIPSPAPSSSPPSDEQHSSSSQSDSSSTTVTTSVSHQQPKMLLLARLNRRMLFRCVIMNATLLICHTPLIVLNLVGNFIYDEFTAGVCTAVGFVFMALEAVITPLMVLYFFPRFQTLFVGQNRVQVEPEQGEAGKNESRPLPEMNHSTTFISQVADTSTPKFHIIRIVV